MRARDGEIENRFGKDAQLTAIRGARAYIGDRLIRVARLHRLLDPGAGPLIAEEAACTDTGHWKVRSWEAAFFPAGPRAGRRPGRLCSSDSWCQGSAATKPFFQGRSSSARQERSGCGIYADWFGPAGAINHYGPLHSLPSAVSDHLTYYLWGPVYSWKEMIVATQNIDQFRSFFWDIEEKALFMSDHASPAASNIGIYVCKTPKKSVRVIWAYLKLYK